MDEWKAGFAHARQTRSDQLREAWSRFELPSMRIYHAFGRCNCSVWYEAGAVAFGSRSALNFCGTGGTAAALLLFADLRSGFTNPLTIHPATQPQPQPQSNDPTIYSVLIPIRPTRLAYTAREQVKHMCLTFSPHAAHQKPSAQPNSINPKARWSPSPPPPASRPQTSPPPAPASSADRASPAAPRPSRTVQGAAAARRTPRRGCLGPPLL